MFCEGVICLSAIEVIETDILMHYRCVLISKLIDYDQRHVSDLT
jgi:hypothetical protein